MSEPAARQQAGPGSSGSNRYRQVYAFIPIAISVLALGTWGFMVAPAASDCSAPSFWTALLHAIMLLRTGSSCQAGIPLPLQLKAAQYLLPFLFYLGAIVAGAEIVIRGLRHDARLAYARTFQNHTIVCGLGETGQETIRQLARHPGKALAICLYTDEPGAQLCERLGITVLFGDATNRKTLAAASIAKARAVILCTGSDARNMEICLAIELAIEAARPPHHQALKLFPELRGAWLLDTLGTGHAPSLRAGVELHPFQTGQIIARLLLRNPHFRAHAPATHLLVIGFGDLAQTILRQAALCNYALPGITLHAAILDFEPPPNPPPEIASWRSLVPLTSTPYRFGAGAETDEAALRAALGRQIPHIAIITLPNDDLALQTAILLRKVLDTRGFAKTPIFVRARQQSRLTALLAKISTIPDAADRLSGFGDLAAVVSPESLFDEQLDTLARAVHQTYLDTATSPSDARVPWAQLAERYRRSSRLAADHLEPKLNFAGYRSAPGEGSGAALTPAAIETIAQAEHHRWCLTLQASGWRHAAQRSDLARTHPLLLPWSDLPPATQSDNRRQAAALAQTLSHAHRTLQRLSLAAEEASR